MKFELMIESDNDALIDGDLATEEVARLLEIAASDVREGRTASRLKDYNGKPVGTWSLSE